ncbi:MAG: hypothetical protein ABIZ64_12050 [Casimicrobium sp.]
MRLFFCLCLIVASPVAATAQIPDELMIDGKRELLHTLPLTGELSDKYREQVLRKYSSEGRCTASWRGYVATWELKSNRLQLRSVHANPCSSQPVEIPLGELFPDRTKPIVATWFTGTLVLPRGKLKKYVHIGFESTFERYLILDVRAGKVLSRKLTNKKPVNEAAN